MADYRAMNRNSKVVDARKKLAATFSTPAPKFTPAGRPGVVSTPNPVAGAGTKFLDQMAKRYTVNTVKGIKDVAVGTVKNNKSGLQNNSLYDPNSFFGRALASAGPMGTAMNYTAGNALNNNAFSDASAATDFVGAGSLIKLGASGVLKAAKVAKPLVPVLTSKVGKAASAASAAIAASGFANSDAAQAVPVSGVTKAGGLLTQLPRGAFENPRLGLKALTEIITGDPTQTSFVAQNYRTLAKLAMGGEASLRGVDDVAETQVKYWANTGRSGFERAGNWLDIPFPQLGRFIDQREASVNDLYKEVSGRPISFGSPKPTVEAVAKGLNERRQDLGPLSSSFGAINNPKAITQGFRSAVTAGKEHIAGSAYQGANIAGQVLGAGNEAANIDELIPLMEKLVKHGAAALNPSELILVDAAFNSSTKGTLPYEIARPIGLAKGGLTMARQLGDDALTHKSYVSFIDRMGKLDSNLVDVNRMEKFAKEIKPKVKFAEKSFGAAKNAFDPSNTLVETRRQLGEWLAGM